MSRSQLNVMFEALISCPLHISFTPKGFSSSNVRLGATMCRTHNRLKVNVTAEDNDFVPWSLCPLLISFTPGRIFIKLWSNVCLSKAKCKSYYSAMQTQGQGYSSRPCDWTFNFVSNIWLSETFCRAHNQLKVKVTIESHDFDKALKVCPLHISFTLEGFSLYFGQIFDSVSRCAELITQPCWLKVKVTIQGDEITPWISCQMFDLVRRCAEPITDTGQGHNWRSLFWALNFVPAPYLLYPWKDFH